MPGARGILAIPHRNVTMKKIITVLLASLLAVVGLAQAKPGSKAPASPPKPAKHQATAAKKKPAKKKATATSLPAANKTAAVHKQDAKPKPKPKPKAISATSTKATAKAKPHPVKAAAKKSAT